MLPKYNYRYKERDKEITIIWMLCYMRFWSERENRVKNRGILIVINVLAGIPSIINSSLFFSWTHLASPAPSMHCTSGHPLVRAWPWLCSHTCQSSPQSLARSHNSPLAHRTLLSPLGPKWKDLFAPSGMPFSELDQVAFKVTYWQAEAKAHLNTC